MDPNDRRAFAALRLSELKTARAWALKETAMNLYTYVYEGPARKHFQWWYGWAVRSRLGPMMEVAGMLKRRFANIITFLKHRITKATSESINAKIQWVKYTAHGFRNKQNFINAIYRPRGAICTRHQGVLLGAVDLLWRGIVADRHSKLHGPRSRGTQSPRPGEPAHQPRTWPPRQLR
jgi:hypothetical protein